MKNQFRIIGGTWRSRRLHFPGTGKLRPSPDRVRETLFNWLAPRIEGAACLDLFAGSGALGLEALSRGADSTLFVDSDRAATRGIQESLELLGATQGRVINMDVAAFLAAAPQPFDIVFVDPPYRRNLVGVTLENLDQHGWVRPGAFVYMEAEAESGAPGLPDGWTLHRSAHAGQVGYHLALVQSGTDSR